MRRGIILGTTFLAALIAAGEVEQGAFGALGIVCAAWLIFVASANIKSKKKAQRGNAELDALTARTIKHNAILMQTDLHVKWYGGGGE